MRFGAKDAERPGQKRPLPFSPAPALGRLQHVELPRPRARPLRVQTAQDDVGAVALPRDDPSRPAAEGCGDAIGAQPTSLSRGAWISCSAITAGSPRRPAEIARAAAIPPAMVVMQGMPRATAALRIW